MPRPRPGPRAAALTGNAIFQLGDTPTATTDNLGAPMTQPPNDPNQWRQYGHQQQPPQWAPPASAPAVKKRRKWPWIVGGVVLVLFVIGLAGNNSRPPSNSTPVVPYTPPQVISAVPAATPGTAAPAPTENTPALSSSGPLTTFSDGTYEVGTGEGQVAPGKYKSPGSGGTCYWARLKHNDGALGDIIANNIGEGQMILNVGKSDGYVEVRGCTFTKA